VLVQLALIDLRTVVRAVYMFGIEDLMHQVFSFIDQLQQFQNI
jgi:hypothetical protein